MRRVALVLIAVLALVTACSGDDDSAEPAGDVAATTTTGDEPAGELRVVAINQLHGLFCPEATDSCDAPSRLELLFRQIAEAGCPDVVGLAEIGPRQTELVPELLPTLCEGEYELLYDPEGQGEPLDQEMILTSLDVVEDAVVDLANIPWSGHWARLDTRLGVVDFVVVHQASSSNNPPCDATNCPPICVAGEETGTCHTRELLAFLDARAGDADIQMVTGDLNDDPMTPRITPYYEAGFEDAWLAAGAPECDPATGSNCTCCIGSPAEPYDGGGLGDPSLIRSSRIDYVLVRNQSGCEIEYGSDTGIFAGPATDRPVNGVYWPSDHAGVLATLQCVR